MSIWLQNRKQNVKTVVLTMKDSMGQYLIVMFKICVEQISWGCDVNINLPCSFSAEWDFVIYDVTLTMFLIFEIVGEGTKKLSSLLVLRVIQIIFERLHDYFEII